MTGNEDEITVDFGKIASFFKGKKGQEAKSKEESSAKPANETADQAKEEEEVSLNLSKVASFLRPNPKEAQQTSESKPKPAKKEREEGAEESSELSLDFSKIKGFFAGINKSYLLILLVLIPLVLGVYIRMQTADLHQTESWARTTVNNYYQNAILGQINQQYPHLPDTKKQELLATEFAKFQKEQAAVIEQQIVTLTEQFKSEYKTESGGNLMPDIDTYYWLRFIENQDRYGHLGDTVVDGKQFDNHFLAPIGREIPPGEYFPVYAGFYFYRLLKIFQHEMTAMTAFSYLPVFLFILSVIFIFLIGKRVAGPVGGFFAALMLAVTPYFVTKTAFGYADTDMYSVFFPLLVTWLFFEAFESRKLWKAVLFSALSGLAVGVFALAWGGWLYIFDFLIAAMGIYLVYYLIVNHRHLAQPRIRSVITELLAVIATFFVISMVFVTLFTGFGIFKMAFTAPISFMSIKSASLYDIWPNVYTTVAEQGIVPFSTLIDDMGGNAGTLLFILAILGVLLTLLKRDRNGHIDPKYAILLLLWFASTLYASTKGVRWILLLVPAFCVAFGAFAGMATQFLSNYLGKELKMGNWLSTVILVLLISLLIVPPALTSNTITRSQVPDINSVWVRSLTAIKTNSSEDAIINSWWDFGHWFKYWADRKVTFDGTSQNIPQAHWIGKVLLTDNEQEAVGILRMLDCKGNVAYDTIRSVLNDSISSINLIDEIILLDAQEAKKLMIKQGIPQNIAEEVLSYTHCQPPEDYFITSTDMVGKAGVWAHFGAWDFTRSSMVNTVNKLGPEEGKKALIDRYGLSSEQAERYYYEINTQDANYWIAPWPSYMSDLAPCSRTGDLLICNDGFRYNLTTMDAYVDTQVGRQYPATFSYIAKNGAFVNKRYNESLLTSTSGGYIGASLVPEGEGYSSILMDPLLTGSMFNRLFYFNGAGIEHFNLFYQDTGFTGFDISIWKVDWPQ